MNRLGEILLAALLACVVFPVVLALHVTMRAYAWINGDRARLPKAGPR